MEAPAPRTRPAAFQRLAVVTLASTLVLVALGGAVRATDSGLACPTWPGCFSAGDFVPSWQLNVWLEHTHRLVAGVVGLQIAALLIWALLRYRRRRAVVWTTVVAAVAVIVQASLGALVVWHLLRADLVTAHLGMAMIIIACLVYLSVRATPTDPPVAPAERRDLRFARTSAAVAALCYVQILIGGHVTGINAGLVWTDFPLMGGALFPPVATEQEAFHVAHRLVAVLLAAAVVGLCVAAVRHRRELLDSGRLAPAHRWLLRLPVLAAALVALQVVLGVANLRNGASVLTVIPHLAVASWIWTVLVLGTVLAYRRAPVLAGEPERLEVPAA